MIRRAARRVIRTLRGKNLPHTFDCEAEGYDRNRARFGLYTPEVLYRALLSLEPTLGPRRRVLDAGAGTGLFIPTLRSFFDQVVALDVAENMLRRAPEVRLSGPDVVPVVGDFFRHPFKPGVFDCIFCSDFLHHTGRADAFVDRACELLGDRGTIVVVEYEPGRVRTRILKLIEEVFLEDLHLISAAELGSRLAARGFSWRSRPVSRFEYLLWAQRNVSTRGED